MSASMQEQVGSIYDDTESDDESQAKNAVNSVEFKSEEGNKLRPPVKKNTMKRHNSDDDRHSKSNRSEGSNISKPESKAMSD